jgi:upstream activation factor subunit UAF30
MPKKTVTPATKKPAAIAKAADTAKTTSVAKTTKAAETAIKEENVIITEDPQLELADEFAAFLTKLKTVSDMMTKLRNDFKLLEKKATREFKAANKANARRKSRQSNRSPSGFVKPTDISNELTVFLGKEKGVQMARTEVTREINAYIRKHNLQDKENGRKINADAKLSKLLKLKSGDELTYFNLQKFMSPHFAKGGNPPVFA